MVHGSSSWQCLEDHKVPGIEPRLFAYKVLVDTLLLPKTKVFPQFSLSFLPISLISKTPFGSHSTLLPAGLICIGKRNRFQFGLVHAEKPQGEKSTRLHVSLLTHLVY